MNAVIEEKTNVERREGFTQVCVWPGTNLGGQPAGEFEDFFEQEFGVPAQFLEIIETYPDFEDGSPVAGTGGRSDMFFAVRGGEDCGKIAVKRLMAGIRWIEDVLDNQAHHGESLYPQRVVQYRSW